MEETIPGDEEFAELLELRTELRRFLHWGETRARAAGVTPAQHQLLIVVRGHGDPAGPTVGDVAESLLLKHHSAVELVQRAEVAGLVAREVDPGDHRMVRVTLSTAGHEVLERLAPLHLEELRRLRADRRGLGADLACPSAAGGHDNARRGSVTDELSPSGEAIVRLASVEDAPRPGSGWRVLVDRRWPPGLRAEDAPFDEWLASLAPAGALARFPGGLSGEEAGAYSTMLRDEHGAELERLAALARSGALVLVTSALDPARSHAALIAREVGSWRAAQHARHGTPE
ncbi:MAG: DUF488 family protein, N3 subclade [Acidimicrobiales bacterium]